MTNRFRNRSSVGEMMQDLNWKSLEDRRRDARLAMMYRIDNNLVAIDKHTKLAPPLRLSRNMHSKSFQVLSSCADYRKWSFFPRTIRDWNNLPPDIVHAGSLESFKTQVTTHFI